MALTQTPRPPSRPILELTPGGPVAAKPESNSLSIICMSKICAISLFRHGHGSAGCLCHASAMTHPPRVRAVFLVLPLLAVLLPVGADPVTPGLSQVEIVPASANTPASFTGVVTGGPPNGTAWLQASVDLGVADPWTNVAATALDNLGSATFTDIYDSRPQAAAAERVFFRMATSSDSPPGNMVFIPGGTFQMGDAFTEGYTGERPVHSVYVSGFYLQNTEVTNDQMVEVLNWAYGQGKLVVGTAMATVKNAAGTQQELVHLDSSYCGILWNATQNRFEMKAAKGSGYPCVEVTWYGSAAWCNYRSEMEGHTPCYSFTDWSCNWSASGYRLPSEAEWEKAARGGLGGKRFPWGDTITHSLANYYSSSSYAYDVSPTRGYHPTYNDSGYPYTSPVGSFAPNGYGLYDMAGNVWEWCWDWYSSSYYSSSPGTDPRGPTTGWDRVLRGGYWVSYAYGCRTAIRYSGSPTSGYAGYRGFRPARSSVP